MAPSLRPARPEKTPSTVSQGGAHRRAQSSDLQRTWGRRGSLCCRLCHPAAGSQSAHPGHGTAPGPGLAHCYWPIGGRLRGTRGGPLRGRVPHGPSSGLSSEKGRWAESEGLPSQPGHRSRNSAAAPTHPWASGSVWGTQDTAGTQTSRSWPGWDEFASLPMGSFGVDLGAEGEWGLLGLGVATEITVPRVALADWRLQVEVRLWVSASVLLGARGAWGALSLLPWAMWKLGKRWAWQECGSLVNDGFSDSLIPATVIWGPFPTWPLAEQETDKASRASRVTQGTAGTGRRKGHCQNTG